MGAGRRSWIRGRAMDVSSPVAGIGARDAGVEVCVVEVVAPEEIVVGVPFEVRYSAERRVSGRLRLTAGTELVPFTLTPLGKDGPVKAPMAGAAHRVRGKTGHFLVSDWGDHPEGAELVLRFEGVKRWMKVVAG